MQQNSIKIVVTLVIAALIAVVGYTIFESGAFSTSEELVDPSGYITFSAHEVNTDRNYPQVFDVASKNFIELEHATSTFYIEMYPGNTNAYLQAPYTVRAAEDMNYPYSGNPQLVYGKTTMELVDIVNPGELSWSPSAQKFTFHALSRKFTNSTEPEVYFAKQNYTDSNNWAVYTADPVTLEIRELTTGHSPVWSADGAYIYYLGVEGLNVFGVESQLAWTVTELPDRFPTPASSMSISQNGQTLYVLITVDSVSPDRLFVYNLSNLKQVLENESELELVRLISMPPGKHADFTLSPDENFGTVTTYGEGFFEISLLNLQTDEITKDSLFTWSELKKYYHFPHTNWTNQSPVVFD